MSASKEQRNARLDALSTATQAWAKARRAALNKNVAFSKRVLKGRTGSDRLNNAAVESATALTVDQINDFLTGD